MTNSGALLPARYPAMVLGLALGMASAAQAAPADSQPSATPSATSGRPAGPSAEPAAANKVEELTVNAIRSASRGLGVDDDKKAALAAEAAQDEAWRSYRKSTPPVTKNPNDMSKDFPGLQTYLPQ